MTARDSLGTGTVGQNQNSARMGEAADGATSQAAAEELRQLVQDMLEVSADGRKLAADLAQSIRDIVNLQCDAIDARARLILARAEGLVGEG